MDDRADNQMTKEDLIQENRRLSDENKRLKKDIRELDIEREQVVSENQELQKRIESLSEQLKEVFDSNTKLILERDDDKKRETMHAGMCSAYRDAIQLMVRAVSYAPVVPSSVVKSEKGD